MSHPLENPFTPPPEHPPKRGYIEATRLLFGNVAAEVVRRKIGEDPVGTPDVWEMTEEERKVYEEALRRGNESKEQKARQRVLSWAKEFDLGGYKWIEENFEFHPDGTFDSTRNLDLSRKNISYLPQGWEEARGDLHLFSNSLVSTKGLPKKIRGDLNLSNNHLTVLEDMPDEIQGFLALSDNFLTSTKGLPKKIGKILFLSNNSATDIPDGLEIGGLVYLSSNQTELKQNAKRKGYSVVIV